MSLKVLSEACRNCMEPEGLRIYQWRAESSWLVRSGSWAYINQWPYIILLFGLPNGVQMSRGTRVDWIHVAEHRKQRRVLVNAVKSLHAAATADNERLCCTEFDRSVKSYLSVRFSLACIAATVSGVKWRQMVVQNRRLAHLMVQYGNMKARLGWKSILRFKLNSYTRKLRYCPSDA